MPKTKLEIIGLIKVGGIVNIDASTKTTLELREIVSVAKINKLPETIRNADVKQQIKAFVNK